MMHCYLTAKLSQINGLHFHTLTYIHTALLVHRLKHWWFITGSNVGFSILPKVWRGGGGSVQSDYWTVLTIFPVSEPPSYRVTLLKRECLCRVVGSSPRVKDMQTGPYTLHCSDTVTLTTERSGTLIVLCVGTGGCARPSWAWTAEHTHTQIEIQSILHTDDTYMLINIMRR